MVEALPFLSPAWKGLFDPKTLDAGSSLASRQELAPIRWLPEEGRLWTYVTPRGEASRRVNIRLADSGEGWAIEEIRCGCSPPAPCVHAAALLSCVPVFRNPPPVVARGRAAFAPALAAPSTVRLDAECAIWLDRLASVAAPPGEGQRLARDRILYVLSQSPPTAMDPGTTTLQAFKTRIRADGSNGKATPFALDRCFGDALPRFITPADVRFARRVQFEHDCFPLTEHTVQLGGDAGPDILAEILATGRCLWTSTAGPVLRAGPPRKARPVWQRDESGRLRAGFEATHVPSHLLALCPPWYVDETTGECGRLDSPLPPRAAETWCRCPLIEPTSVPELRAALERVAPGLSLPVPDVVPVQHCADVKPVPGLRLSIRQLQWWESPWGFEVSGGPEGIHLYVVQPLLWYGETSVPADAYGFSSAEVRRFDGHQLVVIPRQRDEEAAALSRLRRTGLRPASEVLGYCMTQRFEGLWTLPEPGQQRWMELALEVLPALRKEGWRIEQDADARCEICEADAWYLEHHGESDENWFDVELGILLGEERINLLPILLEGLKQQSSIFELKEPGNGNGKRGRDRRVAVPLPDGRTLAFPAARLRAILSTLVELYDPQALAPNQRLRLHRLRALDIAELTEGEGWKWAAPEALRQLCDQLRNLDGLPMSAPPPGLQTSLRPYQLEGLRWLQFIRQIGVGGVLADDMGLGKTIQTLAHILVEKDEGRLDRPALVMCPTTRWSTGGRRRRDSRRRCGCWSCTAPIATSTSAPLRMPI